MLVPLLITVTVGFAAFAVYIDRVEANNRLADIDEELVRADATFDTQTSVVEGSDASSVDPDDSFQPTQDRSPSELGLPVQLLVDADGQILADGGSENPFTSAVLSDLAASGDRVFTVDEPPHRVLVSPQADGTAQITALSLTQLDAASSDFRQTLIVGGLAILALEAIVVSLLTASAVRPITRLAAIAGRVADGELDIEIGDAGGSREISDLANDLERMVTQLRTTIEDSEESAADATKARDDMRRFLADVSHELRTPLTALKGYSDLYAGNMLEEPGALDRAMGRIGDESKRLSVLVTDMLALAREAPTSEAAERFDPGEIVRSVVADLKAAHPEIPIGLEIASEMNCEVLGHAHGLHQAILNVGSNACQHTAPEAGIQFDVTTDETCMFIKVTDHGPGVDPAEIDNIFLPFYRPQTSRGRDGRGGAGLGLAITQQVIDRFDGTVAVEATPGGGATFTLVVPLATR